MTNSSEPKKEKKKKKKGPIRFEAIVPFAIFCGLVWAYFFFLFDSHLKSGFEYAGTQVNGAEVNVGRVKTSFWGASFQLNNLQVTNPEKPTHNRLQVGQIDFRLLWDALLRAKFVMNEAGVRNIGADTKRSKPGRVLPPSEEEGFFSELKSEAAQEIRDRLAQSDLADLVKFFQGFNPKDKLKELGDLKSLAYIQSLETDLNNKQKEWSNSMKELSKLADISDFKNQVNSIRLNTKDPRQLKNSISQAKGLIGTAQGRVNTVTQKANQITADVNGFQNKIGQIDNKVAEDRADIESKLGLPKVDTSGLTEQLFGDIVASRLEEVNRYSELAKKYIPKKAKKSEDSQIKPPPRAIGRNYVYGRPNSYPLFWLKRAVITSKEGESEYSGNIAGELLHATTDQRMINQSTRFRAKGNLPKQKISGIDLFLEFDHRGENAVQKMIASVGAFPMRPIQFSDSKDLKFGLKEATGASKVKAALSGQNFSLRLNNTFSNSVYDVDSSSKLVKELFGGVAREIRTLTLNASVSGTLKKPKIGMDSNLAAALGRALSRQLKGKLAEARAKAEQLIRGKINGPRNQLTGRFNGVRSQTLGQIEAKKRQVAEAKNIAQNKVKEAENKLKSSVAPTNKIKNVGKDLKKKFGF